MLLELLIVVVVVLALAKLIEPVVVRALLSLERGAGNTSLEQTLRKTPEVLEVQTGVELPPTGTLETQNEGFIQNKGFIRKKWRSDGPVETYLKDGGEGAPPYGAHSVDSSKKKEGVE